MTYARPHGLDAALAALARAPHLVLAGGTDVYPAFVGRAIERPILDLSALDEMRGASTADGALRIGALTTWSEVA
ncbi:MAG: FAD binding domain-containing protein, partial [Burkholderiaceae bacterium]